MSFMQDCVRALCIAVMAVPVFTLAGLAEASSNKGTHQTVAVSTPTGKVNTASPDHPVGESAESIFFEPTITPGRPAPLSAAFFEQLFGYGWSADLGVYQLHLTGPEELYQTWPFTTLGTNAAGDPFLFTIRSMLEIDFGQFTYEEQAAASAAFIDRAWAVVGDFETELGLVSTAAILLQGSTDDGSMWWRTMPGFVASADGLPVDLGDQMPNAVIIFEDGCGDAGINYEPNTPEDGGLTVLCAVLIGLLGCTTYHAGCLVDVSNETDWCIQQCHANWRDSGLPLEDYFACTDCCHGRSDIARDACFPCGRESPSQSDFESCYSNMGNDTQ